MGHSYHTPSARSGQTGRPALRCPATHLEVELQHDGDQDAARKVQEQVAGAAEEGGVAREVHDVAERAELHHGEDTEALRGEAPARLERAQQLHSKEAAPRPARGESFAAERLRE